MSCETFMVAVKHHILADHYFNDCRSMLLTTWSGYSTDHSLLTNTRKTANHALRSGKAFCYICIRTVTYSLHAMETWAGTVYLQSMIMVRVSLSLASWKGGWPQTNMNRITPRLQISEKRGRETKTMKNSF